MKKVNKKVGVLRFFQDEVDTLPYTKPFLKWAGGKSQIIDELYRRIPRHILDSRRISTYVEPFVGGGAFFFFLKSRFVIDKSYIFDINKDLILAYKVIQKHPIELIERLKDLEGKYLSLSEDKRKEFYYEIRQSYNEQRFLFSIDYSVLDDISVERVSYIIFLNKTCYNGLYRVNSRGEFNVPYGKYRNPKICDSENILQVSFALENTEIFCEDFEESRKYISSGAFVYLDPPYRPISETSSFTDYTELGFSDEDQIRLAKYFKDMDGRGAYLLLSNSYSHDGFFERLYEGFKIEKIKAKRYINSNPKGRGDVWELIIRNY